MRAKVAALPLVSGSQTFLYVDKKRVRQNHLGLVLEDSEGTEQIPISSFAALMLGPGCSVTSKAVQDVADHGGTILWVGEQGVKFYAGGSGRTSSSENLEKQARLWVTDTLGVAQRMYAIRFGDFPTGSSLAVLRGHEGARVRQAYADLAKEYAVDWERRKFTIGAWSETDDANRAVSSVANGVYALAQSAIVGLGLSAGLGFLHQKNVIGFALDIGDLYREKVTIPLAFRSLRDIKDDPSGGMVRRLCRDEFTKQRLLERMVKDIQTVLDL